MGRSRSLGWQGRQAGPRRLSSVGTPSQGAGHWGPNTGGNLEVTCVLVMLSTVQLQNPDMSE